MKTASGNKAHQSPKMNGLIYFAWQSITYKFRFQILTRLYYAFKISLRVLTITIGFYLKNMVVKKYHFNGNSKKSVTADSDLNQDPWKGLCKSFEIV